MKDWIPAGDFEELPCFRSQSGGWAVATDRLIVQFRPHVSEKHIETFLAAYNATIQERCAGCPNQMVVKVQSPSAAQGLAREWASSPLVLWAQTDCLRECRKKFRPDDTQFGFRGQWDLYNVGDASSMTNRDVCAEKAWDVARGTSSVVIAILDDGFKLDHPDLATNIFSNACEDTPGSDKDGNGYTNDWRGWDFVDNDNDPSPVLPDDYHGTKVAGLVAADTDNGQGIASLAHWCKILPIRIAVDGVLDSDWAKAIRYAASTASVICITAYLDPTDTIYDALRYALVRGRGGKGCVICAALGDGGVKRRYTTDAAAAPEVIVVSGTTPFDHRAWFSDYGSPLTLVCPAGGGGSMYDGYDLITTSTNGDYEYFSGTSAACPLAAAAAALIITKHPSWSGLEVRQMLELSCDKIDAEAHPYNERGWNEEYGFGRVNAWAALTTPQPAWDSYEPDNTAGLASTIEDGELQYHAITPGDDSDWVRLTFTTNTDFRLTVLGTTNAFLRLYDSSTNLIAADNAGCPSYAYLHTNVPSGTYYAKVVSPDTVAIPHYGLHLAMLNASDSYEPDNDKTSSKTILPRQMQYRTLYPTGDVDWATFQLTNAVQVDIATMGDTDAKLELSLWEGASMKAYDYETNINAFISTQLIAGIYYVKVNDCSNNAASAYQLLLETYAPDTHEPDYLTNGATAIVSGQRSSHTLYPTNDTDWLKFSLVRKANVLIMTDTINPFMPISDGDTYLLLYSETNMSQGIATNDDGNNGCFSAIYQRDLKPGTYYAKVTGQSASDKCVDYYLSLDVFEAQTVIDRLISASNSFQIAWSGDAAYTYRIQYTTNSLISTSAWTFATNLEGRVGKNTWVDDGTVTAPAPGSVTQRFYRILSQ